MTQEIIPIISYQFALSEISPIVCVANYQHIPTELRNQTRILEQFSILYSMDSFGSIEILDNIHYFNPGDLLLIPPHLRHKIAISNSGHKFIQIDFSLYRGFEDTYKENSSIYSGKFHLLMSIENGHQIPFYFDKVPESLKTLMEKIVSLKNNDVLNTTLTSEIKLKSIMTEIICTLVELAYNETHDQDFCFANAVQFMDNNFTREISLTELAKIGKTSPSYFSYKFKKHYLLSPMEYVNLKRVTLAKRLLASSNIPLKDIAAKTGFDDYFYFSRIFKKYAHLSPLQFKKDSRRKISSQA